MCLSYMEVREQRSWQKAYVSTTLETIPLCIVNWKSARYYSLSMIWCSSSNLTNIFTSTLNVMVNIYGTLLIYIGNGLLYSAMYYIYPTVLTFCADKLIETIHYSSGHYHFISSEWFHLYLGCYRTTLCPMLKWRRGVKLLLQWTSNEITLHY